MRIPPIGDMDACSLSVVPGEVNNEEGKEKLSTRVPPRSQPCRTVPELSQRNSTASVLDGDTQSSRSSTAGYEPFRWCAEAVLILPRCFTAQKPTHPRVSQHCYLISALGIAKQAGQRIQSYLVMATAVPVSAGCLLCARDNNECCSGSICFSK
jgi:hypothetical protein